MKGKMKVIVLALALIISSVAILTGSMYALAEVPADTSEYDRNDFVDESLLVPAEEPAEEPDEAVEAPVIEGIMVEETKIEVTEDGTLVEGYLVKGTIYEIRNYYVLPRVYHPTLGYAHVTEEPIVWVLSEILDLFVDELGYDYDYIVDWAFSEAEWRGNILVVDVEL